MAETTKSDQLYAATGSSEADDPVEAGRAAATEALAGLAGRTPALIIMYTSVRYDLPALVDAVRGITGHDVPLVGATSSGHFRGGDLTRPATGVAVLAMTAGPYRFGIASVGRLSVDSTAAGAELARAARAAVGPDRPPHATLLLLADGMASQQEALIRGIHSVTGAAIPVVGGGAGDDRRLSETFIFHDEQILTDTAVAVWIGSERPIPVTVGHGWHAIGLPLLVTKVDGQVVHEIAGRPAREVFEEHIRSGDIDELERIRPGGFYSTHAFGLIEPDGSYLVRGVFKDQEGQIRTFAPLPVYSAIQVVACEEEELLDVSHSVAEQSVAGGGNSVLLVFSCVARLDVLHLRGEEEARRLQTAAGHVPIFGIYTYGEFARTTSATGYHNATVAAVAL
jgi:hypothetical protein